MVASHLRFEILGPLSLSSDGKYIELGPPRQRALLAILLTHVGRVVPLPSIIGAIWGHNPPRQVTGTLQAYVSRLRKVLGHHDRSIRVAHHLHGYQLDADARLVDAVIFEAKVKDSRRLLKSGDTEGARTVAWSALDLWKGRPLGELCDYEFAVTEADRLEQIRLRALDLWAQASLRLGAYEEVALQLSEELRRNPGQERLGSQLMRAQYHSGQSAEALLTYERMRIAVAEELGVDLSRELQTLHGEILRQELTSTPEASASSLAGPCAHDTRTPHPQVPVSTTASAAPASPPNRRHIGRQEELARLKGLLADSTHEGGHLLFVIGEQGIGKTQLLREVARMAGPEVRVVSAACSAVPSSPAYWVWEQAVQQLQGEDGQRAPIDLPTPGEWTSAQHFERQMWVCQAVLSAAERGPLVCLLEDLHYADPRVLDLLHLLTRQINRARVLVVASLRDHDLLKDQSLRRAVGRILQESNASTVQLRGLTEAQSGELIATVSGSTPPQDEVRRLHTATGGNPFLLQGLRATRTSADPTHRRPVPFDVREVLYERLSDCSPEAYDVLTLCAVIGTRVRQHLLCDVLASRGLPQTLVDDILVTGLLRPDAADGNLLSFRHGLVRDFLLEDAQPVARARWHQDVSTALAARYRAGDDTAEIRHHCREAARALGAGKGVHPLLDLADQAQERFFHTDAKHRLEDVASVLAELPADEEALAVELLLRKRLMWLGAVLEGYGSRRVKGAFGRALHLEHLLDNTQPTELLHTQAIVAIAEGRYATAAESAGLLHELAEYGGGDQAKSAGCYAEGVTLHVSGRLEESLTVLNQGVEIIDRLLVAPDGELRLNSLLHDQRIDYRAYLALTHWLSGHQAEALRHRSDLLRLTKSHHYDRPWDRAFARYVDAVLAVVEGDVEGAWRAGRAGLDLAARCQLTYWHRMLAVPLGWAEVHQGLREKGLARMRGALREAAEHRTLLRRALHLGLLADAELYTGAEDEARRTIALAAREIEERGEYVYLRPQWPFASLLKEHTARREGTDGGPWSHRASPVRHADEEDR
ncbi:BTAD domain-containing putative transcriptional regulator [Streptomyces sp. NBC_01497]|uniref:BTAD domain-containing putative transcriptional regulator n=1 Tax=Streptomyces sp. NBC_01497 TaxID=2903885 RepID=UPI002E328FEE|nr:BTAD domain-containing putative transcriptional regulator [Streptomyces sp. NBC_01497]